MTSAVPQPIGDQIALADPSWQPVLRRGLEAVAAANPHYLADLAQDSYLPEQGRLFAAFTQPLSRVRYVLVGEGPYPRAASATGVCFMDGAVDSLWSPQGLSKPVNRATSLRNFMKMLLVADGRLATEDTTGPALAGIAEAALANRSNFIQTLPELQERLLENGFLLLNAALAFRPHVPPVREAKAWLPFVQVVLDALLAHADSAAKEPPTLVLWGKIAVQVNALTGAGRFPQRVSEHPYNLTFIANQGMQELFGPMHLLERENHVAA